MRPAPFLLGSVRANRSLLLLLISVAGCQPAPPSTREMDSREPAEYEPGPLPPPGLWQRLEAEAGALADTTGCNDADACRTAPVGERPCGGPRGHLVYCATTTDTAALFAKLEELRQAEEALNREAGAGYTCQPSAPPATRLNQGLCRSDGAGAAILLGESPEPR